MLFFYNPYLITKFEDFVYQTFYKQMLQNSYLDNYFNALRFFIGLWIIRKLRGYRPKSMRKYLLDCYSNLKIVNDL